MSFWFKNCTRCNQGRLFIRKLEDSGQLYLHCEECEWTWVDPNKLDNQSGQLGIEFESKDATEAEISATQWTTYAKHQNSEDE